MNHVSVLSSLLFSVGYEPAERVLEVVFQHGSTYRYYDVPIGVFRELLVAPSKGKYFNRYVVPNYSTSLNSPNQSLRQPRFDADGLGELLAKYIPQKAVGLASELIVSRNVQLVVTKARKTKFGDYSNPRRYGFHKITVNHNLNPHRFLVTLVHELAHLETWDEYRKTVLPHGSEWKENFRNGHEDLVSFLLAQGALHFSQKLDLIFP